MSTSLKALANEMCSCHRKDSCKPLALLTPAVAATFTPPTSVPSSPRAILSPRTPTGASSSPTSTSSFRIPADTHSAKSDLDPTEWKPKLHRGGPSTTSEAFHYLSQFHHTTTLDASDRLSNEKHLTAPGRPYFAHRSTTSVASLATPSLASTPVTEATSPSMSGSYEFGFNTRPLPPRQNPFYSASTGATKGIELVMPHTSPSVAYIAGSVPEASFYTGDWAKRTVAGSPSAYSKEGLGALFGSKSQEK